MQAIAVYVTAFHVHRCIVAIHLGDCVAMRIGLVEDNIQYGGHFTSHLVDVGLLLSSIPHAVDALELNSNYEETSFAQRCFFISLCSSPMLGLPACCVPTLSLKKNPS